jgi:transcriptional regulator with GAF, ATPase, and Fis domain
VYQYPDTDTPVQKGSVFGAMTTQLNQFPAKVEEFFTHKRRINLKSGNKSVLTDNIMCNQEENKTLRHNKIFESINSINQVIHSTLDFDEIMNKTIKEASKTIECDTVVVALKKDEHWKISYTYGYQENLIGIEINEREQPHIFLAIKTKKPSAIKYELVDRDYLKKCNVHSIIVVPLVTNDEGFGVIFFNYQTSTLVFDDIEIYFATQFASSISLVLRNSRLVENLYKEICERKIIELELKKAYENQERKAELEKAYMSLIESEKNLAEAQEMLILEIGAVILKLAKYTGLMKFIVFLDLSLKNSA